MSIERIRRSYRPKHIRLLLIAESPPANGTFFYKVEGSRMTACTAKAFARFTGAQLSGSEFLTAFKRSGCYLEDLCREPVNKLASRERAKAHVAGIAALARRLKRLSPDAVVIILRRIERQVRKAVDLAGLQGPVHALPFPGQGHQIEYSDGLVQLLRRYAKKP